MKTVTIVVAIINDNSEQIRKCLSSIDENLFEVIITCPTYCHTSIGEICEDFSVFKLITLNHTSIRSLWQEGGKLSTTPWIVFIQSSDILTVQLQNNIDQGCRKFTPYNNYKYDLKRISIFLKRRLKYCHFWTGEPIPHIMFKRSVSSEGNNHDQPFKEAWPVPMGNLIHYGPETLSKAITTAIFFMEEWAENVFQKSPDLDKKTIFIKATKESLTSLFNGLFLKKWIRDGFEGFVFSLVDSLIICLGYLRYHEKYIRSGAQLSSQINSIQNILLLQVNGIGDVFQSTPVIKNMKTRLPNAKIDVLITASAKAMIENNPYVNRIFTLPLQPPKEKIKEIVKVLKPFKYDLIINLASRNSTEKLVTSLTSRWKINMNHFYREKLTDVMIGFKKNDSSFIQNEFDLLQKIGFEPKKYMPEIFFKSEEIKDARQFLDNNGFRVKEKLVIVHPFSSDSLREWGIDKFINLTKRLEEEHKCRTLLVGSKNEIDNIRSRVKSQVPQCLIYDGSVRKTLGIINESSLLIGADSLFTHASAAFNIPTIVIQGPIWKPYLGASWDKDLHLNRDNFFVFYKDLPCRDLLNTGCGSCSDQICFDFSVDLISQQVLKMMN